MNADSQTVTVPAQATVEWSGRMKGQRGYSDWSNYELQQLINKVLAAAPKFGIATGITSKCLV